MRVAGVLYQALWEPVFPPSGGGRLSTVPRCWSSLAAWREAAIWLLHAGFPSRAGSRLITH